MRLNSVYFLVLTFLFSCAVYGQQTLTPEPLKQTDLITQMNIKPLDLEEFARKRGLSAGNPARNIVIVFASGLVDETAALFRATNPRRIQLEEMESFELVMPRFKEASSSRHLDLIDFLTGDGRAVGIVSDSDFCCSAACDFISIGSQQLFERARMALTLSKAMLENDRNELVKKFSGKNIEFAQNRKGLDRLFSAKAEKIVGVFFDNMPFEPKDMSQPFFDELVAACLSRLSVEENGFVLLVGSKAAEKAAAEGRFADLIQYLRIQEKVLHQINYFVSGRKDTLVLLVQDTGKTRLKFSESFRLYEFLDLVGRIKEISHEIILGKTAIDSLPAKYSFIAEQDLEKIKAFVADNNLYELHNLLQSSLAKRFQVETSIEDSAVTNPGFAVFARGHGAELFAGMVSFEEFIDRLALISGLKTKR